jgi:hypothetical protein
MAFDFDSSLSAAQNIEKFYRHLESVDAELAAVLKTNLPAVVPEVPAQRRTVRQTFNEAVLKHLDRPKAGPTK